ncbi:MAG: hypothetical protein WDN25_22865 [Acetobacteraceae bacterium]
MYAIAAVPMRRRHWLPVTCAALALCFAAVALSAPGLRPRITLLADDLLGQGNMVSLLLSPPLALEPAWQQARIEASQALNAALGDYTARLDRLAAAQQATAADLARIAADMRRDRASAETLARTVDDVSRQAGELRAAAGAIEARVRATGLLALSLRFRRDVDAGLPLDRDVAALLASGPYPAPLERALRQLRGGSSGMPTMRDLGDEFERVAGEVAARANGGTSWLAGGWNRVGALFGVAATTDALRQVERLRALAADGRFSEAASELEASDAADIGAAWTARVRMRAQAVLAAQAMLGYALAAYENAVAVASVK